MIRRTSCRARLLLHRLDVPILSPTWTAFTAISAWPDGNSGRIRNRTFLPGKASTVDRWKTPPLCDSAVTVLIFPRDQAAERLDAIRQLYIATPADRDAVSPFASTASRDHSDRDAGAKASEEAGINSRSSGIAGDPRDFRRGNSRLMNGRKPLPGSQTGSGDQVGFQDQDSPCEASLAVRAVPKWATSLDHCDRSRLALPIVRTQDAQRKRSQLEPQSQRPPAAAATSIRAFPSA